MVIWFDMDPPLRPSSLRRISSTHNSESLPVGTQTQGACLDPFVSITCKPLQGDNNNNYAGATQSVGLEWTESDDVVSRSTTRLQVELAECVETKTVTTTTTTKRSYPPLIVRPPRSLSSLDTREYPLALKPTPHELASFSYEIDGKVVHLSEERTSLSKTTVILPLLGLMSIILLLMVNLQVDHSPSKSTPKQVHHVEEKTNARQYETPEAYEPSRSMKRFDDSIKEASFSRKTSGPRSPDSLEKRSIKAQNKMGLPKIQVPGSTLGDRLRFDTSTQSTPPNATLLPTPDLSELMPLHHNNASTSSFMTNSTGSFEEPLSPSVMAAQTMFSGAVATPPIAETDLQPFDEISQSLTRSRVPRTLNTTAAQNASLPSPSLSPTLAASNMQLMPFQPADDEELADARLSMLRSRESFERRNDPLGPSKCKTIADVPHQRAVTPADKGHETTILDTRAMLDTFDSMPNEMKNFMMYQFLRRCPRKTLQLVAGVVNPALKYDFLEELPPELSLHILTFLDHKDLCRAAQVSKRWRNIIDSNETAWKQLLDRDGYVLPIGELERAIKCGWGWQDPHGPDACERDLSIRPASSDNESSTPSNASGSIRMTNDTTSRAYGSVKRKRTMGSFGIDRNKRRALSQEPNERRRSAESRHYSMAVVHSMKSEGPNAAATAAALAVPNPHLGLPSLAKLHLFKSLYRRRHMFQRSWLNGTAQPQHIAFPAHPRHVITCLQFDDDKILTGSDDTFIHVYDTKTGKLRKRLEGHDGGVWALQYEGNVLVSGSTDRSVRVWDIEKGLCTQVFHGHTSTVRCLQIIMPVKTGRHVNGKAKMVPEKPLIITGSRDSQLRVWRLPEQGAKRYIQTGPPANDSDCPYFQRVLIGHTQSVRAISAHQDTLVSGSYDNSVRVWKISTGEILHHLTGHDQKVYSVVLDHERRRCISGSMDYTVKIWSLDTGACLFTLEGHTSLVGLLDLRDGRLVSAAADSTLRIWDPEDGHCKNRLTAHSGAITCFQHDSEKVISGSDRTLKMWDVKTGECLKDLLTGLSGVWQVKFDERRCVAAVQRESLTYIEVNHLTFKLYFC